MTGVVWPMRSRSSSSSATPARRLELEVDDAELERRRAAWKAPEPRYARGYGWMFQQHIRQANEGCDFDFLESGFGPPPAEPEIY